MFFPLDTCRDHGRGKILTTADAPSAPHLLEFERRSEGAESVGSTSAKAESVGWLFLSLSSVLAVRRSSDVSPCIMADHWHLMRGVASRG